MSGCCEVERAGRRVVAIALLGDGQRDDRDARIGEPREHAVALVAEEQHLAHGADRRARDVPAAPFSSTE